MTTPSLPPEALAAFSTLMFIAGVGFGCWIGGRDMHRMRRELAEARHAARDALDRALAKDTHDYLTLHAATQGDRGPKPQLDPDLAKLSDTELAELVERRNGEPKHGRLAGLLRS